LKTDNRQVVYVISSTKRKTMGSVCPAIIHSSFKDLDPKLEDFCDHFYEQVFEKVPKVKKYFDEQNFEFQKEDFINGFKEIINRIDNHKSFQQFSRELGVRHSTYQVEIKDYDGIVGLIMGGLNFCMKDSWPSSTYEEWEKLFLAIVVEMKIGAESKELKAS
jgi:hemoglobin-like flavoprotein